MTPIRVSTVFLLAAAGLIVGAGLAFGLLSLGRTPLLITPWLGLVFVVVAAGLWLGGKEVRRLKQREVSRVSPLQAARIAFFARSATLNGAAFTGFLLGGALVNFFRLWAPATASSAVGSAIAATGALAMTIVAWIVERWCLDDSGDSWDRSRTGENPGPSRDAEVTGTARTERRACSQ